MKLATSVAAYLGTCSPLPDGRLGLSPASADGVVGPPNGSIHSLKFTISFLCYVPRMTIEITQQIGDGREASARNLRSKCHREAVITKGA